MRRVVVAFSGVTFGMTFAPATSAFAPGCGLDCGEHPPAPVFTEYEVIESTEPWLLGARVTLSRNEEYPNSDEWYVLTIRADTPNGPAEARYDWL